MKKELIIILAVILTGCENEAVMFEPYSKTPITADCVYTALISMGDFEQVENKPHEIIFSNKTVSGRLQYGTGNEPFTNYEIELTTSQMFSPDLKFISDKTVTKINDMCG